MNSSLGQVVHINHGIFSRAEALDCGETDQSLAAALRAGLVVRLRRGMYAPAETYAASDLSGKHLLHARAAVAAQGGKVALTGASAAALHGFALYQQDLSVVHLLRLDGGSSRRRAKAGPPRRHPRAGAGTDRARRSDSGHASLGSVGGRLPFLARGGGRHGRRGITDRSSHLRCLVRPADGVRVRSWIAAGAHGHQARRRSQRVARRVGDPRPVLPFWDSGTGTAVQGDRRTRVLLATFDFGWDEYRHVAEFDGKVKYERLLRPGESPSDCVFREKRREDRIRAEGCGRGMSRFVWNMVMPDTARRSMTELRQALEQSRRLYGRGRTVAR